MFNLVAYPGTQQSGVLDSNAIKTFVAQSQSSQSRMEEKGLSRDLREEMKLSKDFLALNSWRGQKRKAGYLMGNTLKNMKTSVLVSVPC